MIPYQKDSNLLDNLSEPTSSIISSLSETIRDEGKHWNYGRGQYRTVQVPSGAILFAHRNFIEKLNKN